MSRLIVIFALVMATRLNAADPHSELPQPFDGPVDFASQIKPLLVERCYSCHAGGEQAGGLRLDDKEAALQGGASGPAMLPGDSANSRMVHLVAGYQVKILMPPTGPAFTDREVGLLRAWIDQGAPWPAEK